MCQQAGNTNHNHYADYDSEKESNVLTWKYMNKRSKIPAIFVITSSLDNFPFMQPVGVTTRIGGKKFKWCIPGYNGPGLRDWLLVVFHRNLSGSSLTLPVYSAVCQKYSFVSLIYRRSSPSVILWGVYRRLKNVQGRFNVTSDTNTKRKFKWSVFSPPLQLFWLCVFRQVSHLAQIRAPFPSPRPCQFLRRHMSNL